MSEVIKHGQPSRNTPPSLLEIIEQELFHKSLVEQPLHFSYGQYAKIESIPSMHFTGEIEQYDYETENLYVGTNRIKIQNISLLCSQQLNFRVWLFSTEDFYADTPGKTKLVDVIDFDLTSYGKQIGNTGLWMYSITDLNLLYIDQNSNGKLHIAIENLSESAKSPVDTEDTSVLIVQVLYEDLVR